MRINRAGFYFGQKWFNGWTGERHNRWINGMIERQKKEGEKVNVTTILFDDEVEIIHDRFPIDAVQPLTDKEYYVRGCTALLDAVGQAINKIDNVQKHLPEEHRAGKVLFVITTDGLENSSTEFNYNDIKQ